MYQFFAGGRVFFPKTYIWVSFLWNQKFAKIKGSTVSQSFGPSIEMKGIHGKPQNPEDGKCSKV